MLRCPGLSASDVLGKRPTQSLDCSGAHYVLDKVVTRTERLLPLKNGGAPSKVCHGWVFSRIFLFYEFSKLLTSQLNGYQGRSPKHSTRSPLQLCSPSEQLGGGLHFSLLQQFADILHSPFGAGGAGRADAHCGHCDLALQANGSLGKPWPLLSSSL